MKEVEKFNLENAANTPIVKDLKWLLDTLVVNDLKNIGNLFSINRLSNKRRNKLVEIIYKVLTDENKLSEVVERFIDKEFNLLKKLMKNKGTIQDNYISVENYHFLYMLGIVFIFRRNNKFYISITDDVYNVFKKIDLKKFDKIIDENTKVYNLLKSMVELYGVVSYGDLMDSYCYYYAKDDFVDVPTNALYFCERLDNISHIHTDDNSYFVNSILTHNKFERILDDIVSRQVEIKRKPIKLNELLKYNNTFYYEETTSRKNFKQYLRKNKISEDVIEIIMINMINMFKLGHSFVEVVIAMLEDYGLEITENNIQEIINYLIIIYNNTRIWRNNGWTPLEMRKEYKY